MNNKNILVGAIVVLLVGVGLGYGLFHQSAPSAALQGISSVGVTNVTAKFYSITMAPSTAAATTSSILNTGPSDRSITGITAQCATVGSSNGFLTGGGLAALTLQAATTSTGSNGLQGNTSNLILNSTVSTSTADAYVASSTNPFPNPVARIWPVNTYLTFLFNATNTAACTVGANAMSL